MRLRIPASFRQAGLGDGGLSTLWGFTALSAGRAAALVILAGAVADGITAVIDGTDGWKWAILWGIGAAVLRGSLAWLSQAFATGSALRTKETLRKQLSAHLLSGPAPRVGASAILGTNGLDELDSYYRVVLPAMTNAAVVPLVIGARILFADWASALIIALTIALVPLFMALIGMHTRDKVSASADALARLSDHLVELARGLPVLVGLGRAEEQTLALKTISDDYRTTTLRTLRVAFLSSLALELISTISVAIVAVFIGFRLVDGDLSLNIALLVLILTPECFAPFKDLGSAFHASQNGLGALGRAREIIDAPAARLEVAESDTLSISHLTVRFINRTEATINDLSFSIPRLKITALRGISGSGKSTVLNVLAGVLATGDEATITGAIRGLDQRSVAWVPQDPHFVCDAVLEELRLFAADSSPKGERRVREVLRSLSLDGVAGDDPNQLSPGEVRRLAFARALLRVDAGATLLLLDEPTAHVDPETGRAIELLIESLRGRVTVILASHEESVSELAEFVVTLGAPSGLRVGAVLADDQRREGVDESSGVPEAQGEGYGASAAVALKQFLRPARGRYLAAILIGTLAVLFAMSLTAVSGWLIVKASDHPAIMYLMVAIVGVRFFGIGRSALHYVERLITHDAVFDSVTSLRVRLWDSLVSRGATSRKSLKGATVLDDLVGAADHVRELAPRVLIPLAVGVATCAAVMITVALLDSAAVPLFLVCIGACLLIAPVLTLVADRKANVGSQRLQSAVLRKFAAILGAAADLQANGLGAKVAEDLESLDHAAGERTRRSSWALGLGSAFTVFCCCASAVVSFAVTATGIHAGTLPIEIVAVLAFIPLGLIEPMLGVIEAVQQWPALAFALRRTENAMSQGQVSTKKELHLCGPIRTLELTNLGARWPNAARPAFSGLTTRVDRGQWLVVQGPSGSGKSTLLTVLLGYLAPSAGRYRINGVDESAIDPSSLRSCVAWAPQDGFLFDSTIRANLLIARPRDDRPSDEELIAALRGVGLGTLFDSMPQGLDTHVGSGGTYLSGGQRQRVVVARALLTQADVILLDEPTAHLDAVSASELMADLRTALIGKVVVLVTHHAEENLWADQSLRLDAPRQLSQTMESLAAA